MQASLDLLVTFIVQLFILVDPLAGAPVFLSITPLAIPLLAGPGTIATALIFAGRASGLLGYLALLLGSTVVFASSFVILSKAELLTRVLGKLGTTVVTSIMGLVLASLAVQYVLDGLSTALGRG